MNRWVREQFERQRQLGNVKPDEVLLAELVEARRRTRRKQKQKRSVVRALRKVDDVSSEASLKAIAHELVRKR